MTILLNLNFQEFAELFFNKCLTQHFCLHNLEREREEGEKKWVNIFAWNWKSLEKWKFTCIVYVLGTKHWPLFFFFLDYSYFSKKKYIDRKQKAQI